MSFENDSHAEEILVDSLLKRGVSIKEVAARLLEVGLSPTEVRDLFVRRGHRKFGGSFGERVGWTLIAYPAGPPNGETSFILLEWDERNEERTFARVD